MNRIGIIGLGLMGRVHARNVNTLGGMVVGGADISPTARDEFTHEFGVPTYENHEELIESEAVDAVVITTPNRFHEPAAVAALEGGCDVLVEKPLAHSVEAASRIATAVDGTGNFCMVGFHNRFSPAATAAKAYAEAGRFGDVGHIEATYVRRRGIPSRGSWFTNAELSGGGALIDVGVHVVDLALSILDFPDVTEVTGIARSNFGARDDYADPDGFARAWGSESEEFDVDDSVSAFIRCSTGQSIALEVAWATNRPPANELLIRGTQAGARFELEGEIVELYETSQLGVDHYVTSEIDARGGPDGHLAEMEYFLEAVGSGDGPELNTVSEGLAVQRVLEAIYRSSESGRACSVEPAAPSRAD